MAQSLFISSATVNFSRSLPYGIYSGNKYYVVQIGIKFERNNEDGGGQRNIIEK
jgi:hypothetical protein